MIGLTMRAMCNRWERMPAMICTKARSRCRLSICSSTAAALNARKCARRSKKATDAILKTFPMHCAHRARSTTLENARSAKRNTLLARCVRDVEAGGSNPLTPTTFLTTTVQTLRLNAFPLWTQLGVIVALLLLSAFFSISETAMVALNRHRLKHAVRQGALGARTTQRLLARTDQLLSFLLIGNSLINTVISVLATSIALRVFGVHPSVLATATAGIAFLIILLSEITPKIAGATYPEKIALPVSLVLAPLMRITRPFVGCLNLFASGLLRLLRIDTRHAQTHRLSIDELRAMVLEESHFLPYPHRRILLNLFDLEHTSVDDVMTPRTRIEALDFNAPIEHLLQQLDASKRHALPVYEDDINRPLGILEVRKTFAARRAGLFQHERLRALLSEPCFIPSGTPVFQQLQSFQKHPHPVALVVDEYGEVQGLVT